MALTLMNNRRSKMSLNKHCKIATSLLTSTIWLAANTLIISFMVSLSHSITTAQTYPLLDKGNPLHSSWDSLAASSKNVTTIESTPTTSDKPVVERVNEAADTPIRIENLDNVPITISTASVKATKLARKERLTPADTNVDEIVIKPNVALINGGKPIKGLVLQFINTESNWRGATSKHFENGLQANGSYTISGTFLRQLGPLEALAVKVLGIKFEDGGIWGEGLNVPAGSEMPKVLRRTTGVLESAITKRVKPAYPDEAKKVRMTGLVSVDIIVDEEGKVISAKASSGPPILGDAAVNAVRQWQFKPTTLTGLPAKVIGTIIVRFER